MSSQQGKAPGSIGAQSKSDRPSAVAKHSLQQQGDVPRDERYEYDMYKRVHKLSERLGKERDGLCVPMYTIEDRRHTEPGHFEEYQLVPVYDGHGVTQWRPRSDVEAIPTPQCTARTHTHCGETAQKRGQQAQKVSSSSGGSGSKGLEGRTGTPASQTKSKAPTAPNANNCCPRYSFGDHPPPYDAVMTQQSCWIPLYDSIGADEKVLDVEDDDYKEKAL